ncbi:uncharacterized protein LOC129588348 [Paramacrobiotus metropolitanus]|uniref:uncharacterized protein LOC129588348 n=1 Tax=Paramacrobiotus metropolitanus TaxID=2943436 RepID=UPI002445EF88|nr:uncharacterized protein LOC129588348 [Paramacrobiotus metropolitanus]
MARIPSSSRPNSEMEDLGNFHLDETASDSSQRRPRRSITDIFPSCGETTQSSTQNAYDLPKGSLGTLRHTSSPHTSSQLIRASNLRSRAFRSEIPNLLSHSTYLPPYIDNYWDLVKQRSIILQKAAATVSAAYEITYGEAIARNSLFMISALRDGLIPHQPQATPLRSLQVFQQSMTVDVMRYTGFVTSLPGFHDFSKNDKKILLGERHMIYQLVICSPYFYKGEYYYCMNGPDELHMCWSVAEGLGLPLDFLRFCGSIPFLVNDIGLTLAETYLLAAVTIFAPSVLSNVSNKALVAAHYDFYMDALFYQLGNRLSIADRAITSVKLEKVIQMFPLIDKISMGYFQNLDLSHVPVRSREVMFD